MAPGILSVSERERGLERMLTGFRVLKTCHESNVCQACDRANRQGALSHNSRQTLKILA